MRPWVDWNHPAPIGDGDTEACVPPLEFFIGKF